jgi:hypothetical protein
MPADAVIDEVVASLGSNESSQRGRTFQAMFLVQPVHPERLSKVLLARDLEIVAALIKAIRPKSEDRDRLLAAACHIWEISPHQLKDFEGLEPLVMQWIDNPPANSDLYSGHSWYTVANALTRKNPETPDLALKLMKVATSDGVFIDISQVVRQLGRHAEPAVPLIIERFLTEWKKIEDEVAANRAAQRPRIVGTLGHTVAACSIELLGEIGTGKQAALLLKELNMMGTITSGVDSVEVSVFREAKKAIDKFTEIPAEDGPGILRDGSLVCGWWQVQAVNSVPAAQKEAWIRRDAVVWWNRNDDGTLTSDSLAGQSLGLQMELDSTRSPKEIMSRATSGSGNPEFIRRGVYELTETTLKIYLAPVGKPVPSEIVKEASAIPEGYTLLELRRSLSIPRSAETPE